ncbi:DinB family protein [Stieleria varia]|uniref:DinB superfamily protein n=1 Tax=Stieleria varia TaxID=2528005 RepID=A0A5C6B4A9_9BACT|nr:DinB family protein [Stieleria varia]TWU06116.1 DinB superfamily protein [Stieleria varia]
MKQRFASRRCVGDEYSADYHRQLIENVPGDCVLSVMQDQMHWLCELASSISTEQVDRIHSPYGWTIRQVFEHCANAERVSGYRILRFAAGDPTPLPGWDENAYADSRFGLGNFSHLITELGDLRKANLMLLKRLSPLAWDRRGTADGQQLTTRALAWIAAGHLQHHLEIVEKRCGVMVPRHSNRGE